MKYISMLALLFLISACKEEGAIGNQPQPSVSTNTTQSNASAGSVLSGVNGGATGRLYLVDEGDYFDLYTGLTTSLSRHKIIPRDDGLEYAEIIYEDGEATNECGDVVDVTRVKIRNMNTGLPESVFGIVQNLFDDVRLSPDGCVKRKQAACIFAQMFQCRVSCGVCMQQNID